MLTGIARRNNMQLPKVKVIPQKTEYQTIGFKGLNRMPVTDSGELAAMTNISSKYSPCLYPRESREVIKTLTNGTALFAANGKLCWVDGTNFYYDGVSKGTVTEGPKSIAEYFGTILIFPDKKFYNYVTNTFGNIQNCPDIKYVCVHNNRAFGVGGNGFYASKLGDPLVWNQFSIPILSEDSWQVNTGEEGDFTGIKVVQNHVVATKEGYLYELYGSKPANFSLQKIVDVGCIDSKSIVEIDGVMYFLSQDGFRAYAGAFPKPISINLNENYVSCTAGTDGRRYYASLYNGKEYNLYVYDTYTGYWYREDNLHVVDFIQYNDSLCALSENFVYKFNSGNEQVTWSFEMEFTENYMGKKINSNIKVTAELDTRSSFSIYYSTDDGEYRLARTCEYMSGYKLITVDITPERCDKFKLKIAGIGNVKIYELLRVISFGSAITAGNNDIFTYDRLDTMTWDEIDTMQCSKLNRYEVG